MAVKVGMGTQYGVAPEVTVGTFVAPTRFMPVDTVTPSLDVNDYDSQSLQPGQYAQQTALSVQTTRSGGIQITRPVLSKGEGMFLNTLHGATVTPTTTTSPAYSQAHPLGLTLPDLKALSQQILVPGSDGTENIVSALGTLPKSVKYSIEAGGALMCEWDFWATDVNVTESKATASYATSPELFSSALTTLLVGGSAPVGDPTAFECTISIPRADGRFFLNGTATAGEALQNEYLTVAGSWTAEVETAAQFTAFKAGTDRTLRLTCLGTAAIATARTAKFELDFACIQTMSHVPGVNGKGIATVTVPFRALISSTNPLVTINTESLDAAL